MRGDERSGRGIGRGMAAIGPVKAAGGDCGAGRLPSHRANAETPQALAQGVLEHLVNGDRDGIQSRTDN